MPNNASEKQGSLQEVPVERITRYLDEREIGHEVLEHDEVFTAAAEARAAGVPAGDTAKGVLLHTGDGYLLAVIPASERLDLTKVMRATGRKELRLAIESEMRVLHPDLELGSLPPFGPDFPSLEVFDRRLSEHDRILCSAGDHRHSVLIDPKEIIALVKPTLADICAE
ncbi:MAG: aminoacyl-tRNA deacylase [Solirubrobacterales bacterium]